MKLIWEIWVNFDAAGNLYFAAAGANKIYEKNTNGTTIVVAGKGPAAFFGDGGQATNAYLNVPRGVAFDPYGNMFIDDEHNNRIRKVDTNGIITTVAGNGTNSYSGDGGAATNASLNVPANLTLDAIGNLYIADSGNNRIREVHLAGLPTLTLANLSAANAGNYSVVVTSPYGSVTSSIAGLYLPPYLTAQPQSASVFLASNATFTVSAAGTAPLNYQWLFNGTNLDGAVTAAYAISNAQPAAAGGYSVVVTNSYGSITSSIASLAVTLPPIIPTFAQTNGSSTLGFTWSTISGMTYQVEYKTNLSQPGWINLGAPISTTNTAASVLDSFGTDPQRFYRVELLQ